MLTDGNRFHNQTNMDIRKDRDLRPEAMVALADDARWIWIADKSGGNCYVEFLKFLDFESRPVEAWIQLSAETSLRLSVNDICIYSGPPREVSPYFYFDTIDLVPHLRVGRNKIRIIAHHQGQNSASYQTGVPAILIAGRCASARKPLVHFSEAAGWQARLVTRYNSDSHRLHSCLGFSEHVDFNALEAPWQEAGDVARHPWSERPEALPRDIPFFSNVIRNPVSVIPHSGGWLFDFGMEVSGNVELEIMAGRPLSLCVSYAEALVGGRVAAEKGGACYYDILELPEKEITWLSYEKRAFRYLHLSEPVGVLKARVIEQAYPYAPLYAGSGAYHRNQESGEGRLVNRILDVSARTIAVNTEDLLTDCPWRERAQYFDCYYYLGAMHTLFGTLEPIRRFLHQFPRGADETGLLRMCYPSPKGTTIIPDFSISYPVLLKRYLELSGDLETVRQNLYFAGRGVTSFQMHEDEEGLLVDVPGWIFLDNTFELPKFPRSAALNAVYHGGHSAMAALMRACGQPGQAAKFDAMATRIRASFRKTFLRGNRLFDSDSTPMHETFRHWVYNFSSDSGCWNGKSFRLRAAFRLVNPGSPLRLAVHAGARVWVDGRLVGHIKEGGSWIRSAMYHPVELQTPADTSWHRLDLEVEWSGIDWECYLSHAGDVEWSKVLVWEEDEFGKCLPDTVPPQRAVESTIRNHVLPWMTQITVGYSAFHGLLEDDEARRLLRECLPTMYIFPLAKRITPFFAAIDDNRGSTRILPCNVPASMFHFCHALRKYGMAREARELLLPIYEGMLERGATTWWEEWNTRSSLCHAWASFVVEFLDVGAIDR